MSAATEMKKREKMKAQPYQSLMVCELCRREKKHRGEIDAMLDEFLQAGEKFWLAGVSYGFRLAMSLKVRTATTTNRKKNDDRLT
jgi:hypothetical protein